MIAKAESSRTNNRRNTAKNQLHKILNRLNMFIQVTTAQFLHLFHSTLDMAYSAIFDRLHFHFDIGSPAAKSLQLLSCTRRHDSAADQNKSVIDRSVAE